MVANLAGMGLTATQQSDIQQAIQTGSTANLTSDEISIFNSIQSNQASNTDSSKGLTVESTKPQTQVSTTTTTNADGSTTEHTTTETKSSAAFYDSQEQIINNAISNGKQAADDYNNNLQSKGPDGARLKADRMFYQSETKALKGAVAPDVYQEKIDTKGVYDNQSGQVTAKNEADCTLGVLKGSNSEIRDYLTNSSNPKIRDLATKAKGGDLASTYALIQIVDSWQPDMVQNAKDGKVTRDTYEGKDGKISTTATDDSTLHNVGGQAIKNGKGEPNGGTWKVPYEYMSEEDKTKHPQPPVKGETKGADVIPDPKTGTGDSAVKTGEAPESKKSSTTYAYAYNNQRLQVSMNLAPDTEKALEDLGVCSSHHQQSGTPGVAGSYTDQGQVYVKQLDYNKLYDLADSGKIPYDRNTGVATLPGGQKVNLWEIKKDLASSLQDHNQKFSVNVTD